MGFLNGGRLRDLKISEELSKILHTTCLNCLSQFDKGDRRPYMVGPCQHLYCAQCIETVVFNHGEEASCPQCGKNITKGNIRRNIYLEQVIEIQSESGTNGQKSKIRQIEQDVARKFLSAFPLFCQCCQELFDPDEGRRPVMICKGSHIVCSKCLRGKLKDQRRCRNCGERMFDQDNLYNFQLFELMMQFISIALFNRKLILVVGERQFTMSVDEEITLKDAFHCLQEHDLISKELEIKECTFHHLMQNEDYEQEQREVAFTSSLKSISKDGNVTINMQFAPNALKKGARVTVASKIVQKLAIKINNFQKEQKFSYIDREKPENPGRFQPIREEEEEDPIQPLYPDLQYVPIRQEHQPIIIKQRSEIKGPSASQLKLIKISSLRQEQKIDERNINKILKQSRIPKRKEVGLGTEISEQVMENITTKVPQGNARNQIFNEFLINHISNPQDEPLICFRTEKIVNKPFTQEQLKADVILEKEIEEKAQKGDTMALLLMILKKQLEDGDIRVIFSPKSTQRSKMSLKIITSHFISDRIVIKETFNEDEHWFFEKLYESEVNLAAFLDLQKKRMATKFGISEESLVFHRLVKGSMVLYMSTHEGQELARNIRHNLDRDIEICPFFKQLELSPEDFDAAGKINFPKNNAELQYRGNWPYYQPINSVRFGIQVKGLFDKGQNKWLTMNNQAGEWAVGFHGVRNPNSNYKNYKNVIQGIIGSRSRSNIKILSESVSYQNERCANKEGTLGVGVMLTPSIQMAFSQTEAVQIGGKIYHLVFQCRLKPDEIKISSKNNCKWVVNRSSAIRPYGIVIVENQARLTYPTIEKQFGKPFLYNDYKSRIQKAL